MRLTPRLVATDTPPIPAAARWRTAYDGRFGPIIDLAQAVPATPPPEELLQRLAASAAAAETTTYGPIVGDAGLRGALAADIADVYAGDVAAEDIVITAGCNQAFYVAMLALASPGDAVILPTPWYFNYKMTLDMLGIAAVPLPCRADAGFFPDVADARALLSSATSAIVLVTPNNPSGAVYPPEVIAAFGAFARDAGIALVIDETYRDFLPKGVGRPHDLLARPGWRDTVIQLYSFSKSFAIPGHRLGALTAGQSAIEQIAKVLDCMTICPPRVAQAPVAWAIEGTRVWREEMRAVINARSGLFRAAIARAPGWSISSAGAYFAYVKHPLAASAEVAAERLAAEAGIVTLPGSFFGPGQDDHLRFAVANVGDSQLKIVSERLRAVKPEKLTSFTAR